METNGRSGWTLSVQVLFKAAIDVIRGGEDVGWYVVRLVSYKKMS